MARHYLATIAGVPLALVLAGPAAAQAGGSISIPAQPVATALQALSRRAHVNILFAPTVVTGLRSREVRGARTVDQAIGVILAGTPLEAVHDPVGGYIVRRRAVPVAAAPPVGHPLPSGGIAFPRRSAPQLPAATLPRSLSADIVVSAPRSDEEAAQRLPMAITIVSPARITAAGASTIADLAPLVLGLQVAPVRTNALTFIRGVGTTISSPNIDPAVAVNLNGANVPTELTAIGLFDVQRIEVLPGPQGTAYGHNGIGGVINIVTRRPSFEISADGFAELGGYGRVQLQAGADMPLTGNLAVRSALNITRHAGYDSNGGDDQHVVAARFTSLWNPDVDTTATGIVTYSRERGIGPFNFNVPVFYGPYRRQDFDPKASNFFIDYRALLASQEILHRFSDRVHLTYVLSYDHLDQTTRTAGWSGTPPAILDAAQKNETVSQELRLNLSTRRVAAVGGLVWRHVDATYVSRTDDQASPVSTTNSIGPLLAHNRAWAAFGQATASILRGLRLTGGLRYSQTEKTLLGTNTTATTDPASGTGTIDIFPYAGSAQLVHLDWRTQIEADIAAGTLLYGGVTTGSTPGGLSAAPAELGNSAAAGFRPVYLTAYASGLKSRVLRNERLIVNTEAFYYGYRNYQVSQRNLATGQNIVYTAERARVYGIQVDLRARSARRDELAIGVLLQRAQAIALTTPAGRFDGFQLPFAPNATAIASYRHVFDLANGARLETFVSGEATASRWGTYTHAAGTFVGPTGSMDVTFTYHPRRAGYALSLWSRNLTNAVIPTQITTAPAPVGPGQEFLRAPRTIGVRLGFDLDKRR